MEAARRRRPTLILAEEEDRSTLPRRPALLRSPPTVTLMDRHKDRML